MRFFVASFYFIIFSLYILHASDNGAKNEDIIGGLEFYAKQTAQQGTSYKVLPKNTKFNGSLLEIEVDFSIYSSSNIGHIITCKGEKSELFNLIAVQFNQEDSLQLDLNLTVIDEKLSTFILPKECGISNWHRLKIGLSTEGGYGYISLGDRVSEVRFDPFKLDEEYNIIFGVCEHYLPLMSFSIKDLMVNIDGDKEYFPLTEPEGTIVHNSEGEVRGEVLNPIWMINQHLNWTKLCEFETTEVTPSFLDSKYSRVVFYNSEGVKIYNINNKNIIDRDHSFDYPFMVNNSGNFYFNQSSGDLFLYNNKLGDERAKYSTAIYNYRNNTLEPLSSSENECRFHHNALFGDLSQNEIYQFGGYGKYKYYNTFKQYSFEDNSWSETEFKGDEIYPRFYPSSGRRIENGEQIVYLYGGYGNKSGNQRDGGDYFHDLYRIDLDKRQIEAICKFKKTPSETVPCNNLIIDDSKSQFYTMCYTQYKPESQLQLKQFDWQTGESKVVSDSIHFISTKISTNVYLYEHKEANQLFCVIQEFTENDKSTVKLYSIRTPLLFSQEVQRAEKSSATWLYILLIALLIGVAILSLKIRKRGKSISDGIIQSNDNIEPSDVDGLVGANMERNAIFLLGNFVVLDRDKTNITHLFSPKIRHMFLLILFHSYSKKEQGIHADTLSTILWEGKPLANARNLRGVNIKKLKDAISSIDGIELINNNSYWRVDIDLNLVYCDYVALVEFLERGTKGEVDRDELLKFLPLLSNGQLCKSEEAEWIDGFKSNFEDGVLSVYMPLMNECFEHKHFKQSYEIATVLLRIDPFNVAIAQIMVKSLVGMGDSVKATIKFRQFALTYYQVYSVNLTYTDFVK